MLTETGDNPRARCHHKIANLFTGAIAAYVRQNPDLLKDEERLKAGVKTLVKLMETVLDTIDGYVLTDRENGGDR